MDLSCRLSWSVTIEPGTMDTDRDYGMRHLSVTVTGSKYSGSVNMEPGAIDADKNMDTGTRCSTTKTYSRHFGSVTMEPGTKDTD